MNKDLDGVPLFNTSPPPTPPGYYENKAQPMTIQDFDRAIKALEDKVIHGS